MRIRVEGVSEMAGAMRTAANTGIHNGLEKIALRGEALVKEEAPVGASGQLANSANHHVTGNVATLFIGPPADVYGAPVEFGTRPHFPPPQSLVPWVMKKFNPNSEEEALQIAWAIARKIAKRGTPPQQYFKRATDKLTQEAQPIMEHEIAEALIAAGFGGN